LIAGWFSEAYHPGIASAVNMPAMAPMANGMASDRINRNILVIFISRNFNIQMAVVATPLIQVPFTVFLFLFSY
jgi:hypothetical protein